RVAVPPTPPGAAEGGGLAVSRRISLLDPAVVAPPEKPAAGVEEGRADGDAPLGQAEAGFVNGDPQQGAIVDQGRLSIADCRLVASSIFDRHSSIFNCPMVHFAATGTWVSAGGAWPPGAPPAPHEGDPGRPA